MPTSQQHGRGARSNTISTRFEVLAKDPFDDGWSTTEALPLTPTTLHIDRARKVITYNRSPDVPFDRSINPYRGCEHGCAYCFARPTHAYVGYSPGLDFETQLFYKPDAPEILRQELSHPHYQCRPLALGVNTDAYQPAERKLAITRRILEVLTEFRHPVTIITKAALIERDLDLLAPLAHAGLARVAISLTTLQAPLARRMEPRAAAPKRRLATIASLHAAGIPVDVLFAPLIPGLNDHEMEAVLAASKAASAVTADYVMLRLPHELRELFSEWIAHHYPDRADHVLSLVRQCRGGALYDSDFATRMSGSGAIAAVLAQRFALATRRLGFTDRSTIAPLDTSQFTVPGRQLRLF